jgi:RNA polymerase sigma-70 factor, ECF subfamily
VAADLRDETDLVARCLARDEDALRILERDYIQRVDGALAALRLSPAERDDVRQKLWIRLLVGDAPRLRLYAGQGSLRGFIRAVAVRLALDERSPTGRRLFEGDDALLDLPDPAAGPDSALAKRVSRAQFRAAFQIALAALTPTERTVLRQIYVDGLSTEAVARLHGTHRATIFRWTVESRRKLGAELRNELARSLKLRPAEVPSFAAFVQSELSLSLARVLG